MYVVRRDLLMRVQIVSECKLLKETMIVIVIEMDIQIDKDSVSERKIEC